MKSWSVARTAGQNADLSRDGAADLVVRVGTTLRMFLQRTDAMGKATGKFDAQGDFSLPLDAVAGDLAIGEFRGKGQHEILISTQPLSGNSQLFAVGLGSDRRTWSGQGTMANTLLNASAMSIGDFNRDGQPDIVLIDKTHELMSVTTWRTPSEPRTRAYYVGHSPAAVTVGAIDDDDLPDLAFAVQVSSQPGFISLSTVYSLPMGGLP